MSAWRTNESTARSSSRDETHRRLFAGGAHRCLELDAGRLRVALGLAGDHSLELLDLPALDVGERCLDPAGRLGLAALDLLRERLLAPAQPLGDLLDHPPALAGVRLQLLQRLGDGGLRRALELLAQPDAPRRAARRRSRRARPPRPRSGPPPRRSAASAAARAGAPRSRGSAARGRGRRPRSGAAPRRAARCRPTRPRARHRPRARGRSAPAAASRRSAAPPRPGSRASPPASARVATSAPPRLRRSPRRRAP